MVGNARGGPPKPSKRGNFTKHIVRDAAEIRRFLIQSNQWRVLQDKIFDAEKVAIESHQSAETGATGVPKGGF